MMAFLRVATIKNSSSSKLFHTYTIENWTKWKLYLRENNVGDAAIVYPDSTINVKVR